MCVRKIPWRRAWQPLQYSCLENPMDRGVWQVTVQRVAQSQTQLKQLGTAMKYTIHSNAKKAKKKESLGVRTVFLIIKAFTWA